MSLSVSNLSNIDKTAILYTTDKPADDQVFIFTRHLDHYHMFAPVILPSQLGIVSPRPSSHPRRMEVLFIGEFNILLGRSLRMLNTYFIPVVSKFAELYTVSSSVTLALST